MSEPVQTQPHISGLGIAALALGVIACLGAWIPFLGLLTIPIAGIGLALAGVGLVVSLAGGKSGVGMPAAGGFVCGAAIALALFVTGATSVGIGTALNEAQKKGAEPPPRAQATPPTTSTTRIGKFGISVPVSRQATGPASVATAQLGKVQVTIREVSVGKVKLESGTSKEIVLQIRLSVLNTDQTRKLDYLSWRGGVTIDDYVATLRDNLGNSYDRMTWYSHPEGAADSAASIYPEASLDDVLCFEPPVGRAEELILNLPGKNVGQPGQVTVRIPIGKISK